MKRTKGRPKHEVTDANRLKIKILRASGLDQKKIARILDINVDTLIRYYKKEVDEGAEELNGRVVNSLFQNAIKGNVTAQIFWLKTRARWRETDSLNEKFELPALVEVKVTKAPESE